MPTAGVVLVKRPSPTGSLVASTLLMEGVVTGVTDGVVGTAGAAGTDGAVGVVGTVGAAGTDGTAGVAGKAGVAGTAGAAGTDGTVGVAGTVGTVGTVLLATTAAPVSLPGLLLEPPPPQLASKAVISSTGSLELSAGLTCQEACNRGVRVFFIKMLRSISWMDNITPAYQNNCANQLWRNNGGGLCRTVDEAPEKGAVLDVTVIAQYQRMTHYGITGFGTVSAFAKALQRHADHKQLGAAVKDMYQSDE